MFFLKNHLFSQHFYINIIGHFQNPQISEKFLGEV
nr:MAG TPA: hypothetical protein [Caudoviricetes sp.]